MATQGPTILPVPVQVWVTPRATSPTPSLCFVLGEPPRGAEVAQDCPCPGRLCVPAFPSLQPHPCSDQAQRPHPCVPIPALPRSASQSPCPCPHPTEQLVPPSTFTVHAWAVKCFGTRSRHHCAAPSLGARPPRKPLLGTTVPRGCGSVTAHLHPSPQPRRVFTFALSFRYFPSGAAQLCSLLQM